MATDIKTEITRIKQAKSDIRSVIESKGVEVDPRATIDKYASFIKDIGDIELIDAEFNSNGDYTAPSGQAYQNVTVDVTFTPTLQNKTITTNGSYTADQGYDGLGTVTVDVQPGGGESYITAYYSITTYDYYNNTDAWSGRIINSLTNVIEEWIDGVQVTPMTDTYQFSMNIVHTVKFVYDPQHNETVANMFDYYGITPMYVDWSHFTGTINYSGRVNYAELLPNIVKPVPLLNLEPKIIQQNTTDLTNVTVGIGNSSHACVVYNHPTLASYDNKIIYNKTNNQIVKYYSSIYEFLYVPEFLSNGAVIDTTALGGTIERYYINDNIDELHTATNGGNMIFTGTTPPDVIDFANEMWDATTIFVPNSSQQAYYDTILNTSTYTDMSKFDIRPVCKFLCEYNWTATQHQERGTFYVANRGWQRFSIVKLYDAQDNLVAEVADGGMAFDPSKSLPTYGTYRAELYCRNFDGWEFPELQNDTDAVVIDASDVYYTRVGDFRLSGLRYLEELIMPASATDLANGFLWNCPKITKVTLLSQSVPGINVDNAFLADEGATRPCPDVIVYDVAAYRADGNWAFLEGDGRINLVQA